ncbi:bifunctional oligoribonuclease/PAP phosphatase NrnA [Virgibacillus dakarensis]|uniref:Oligoribonuclease n=1 Tax=Lentibacillus populi TaxID=1827502 RepID=A0A9W5X3J5_9BACI|nr:MULTISPECIES: bifunctional oligoribonuclease/PAP phosphatase NrnA [Bacillaceae]MBT2216573.1 bifunctional oligoribonuclease/PAP phosphatase NrnA [Virgibacillus dakarensis]MTW84295.1 bifunctional oligoribonuclease/PAP phosphatase NrnA [Virgibacillus dakarensis]GGB27559.1 oligoribonuclease [Lentibacillus populi]
MTFDKIIQAINDHNTIIIHRHVRPDPDAYGSQVGLCELIKQTYPDKHVYVVGEEDPSLRFLARMDTIDDSVYHGALVIVCDTANTERIDNERYKKGELLIKIDHHPNVDPYGDVMWVDTGASSTSEIVYDFYLYAKEKGYQLNDEAARLLYGGIVGDTGRFLFPSATKKTFQYAAELVTYNFDRTALYDGIYRIDDNVARLKGYILQNFTLTPSGMSTIKLSKELLNEYHMKPIETSQIVGVLGDIAGIKAWVIFIEEDDLIRVRLRSKGPIVNTIAAKYDGGGHPMAAGASVAKWEDTEQVIQDLDEACRNYQGK